MWTQPQHFFRLDAGMCPLLHVYHCLWQKEHFCLLACCLYLWAIPLGNIQKWIYCSYNSFHWLDMYCFNAGTLNLTYSNNVKSQEYKWRWQLEVRDLLRSLFKHISSPLSTSITFLVKGLIDLSHNLVWTALSRHEDAIFHFYTSVNRALQCDHFARTCE